jgi:hypothetical protein
VAQAIYTQTIIAIIWDFDRTLTVGYSQEPIFAEYGVDGDKFWREVDGLKELYKSRGIRVGSDTAYLIHMLTYVREGQFRGLTNSKLKDLGSGIEMCPGIPDVLAYLSSIPDSDARYHQHGIAVEHFIVSTGIRQLIEGSAVGPLVKEIWANEFVDQPPSAGYDLGKHRFDSEEGEIAQIGFMVDNTSKTRAIFEINKGPDVDVNARMDESDRRVPIRNMIYVADGPSDVPVCSVLGKFGGSRLGVYQRGLPTNFSQVKQLEDDGRVNSIAEADFRSETQARLWLDAAVRELANRICTERDRYLEAIRAAPGHVVS